VIRAVRLKEMMDWGTARPDYIAGLRAATATVVPLIIGEATHRPQLLWVALGGWLGTFADPGGPYPLRAATLLAYVAAGSASVLAGTFCASHPGLSVPVLFFWGVGSALWRVYGEAAGGVGSLSLIAFAIALGTPAPSLHSLALRGALFAVGVLWAAAMALALWPVHPYRPVRRAVAACHRALAQQARQLATGGLGWFDAAAGNRRGIRALLENARSVVGTVRRGRSGESQRSDLLVALYEAAELSLGDLSALAETLQSREERGERRPVWLDGTLETFAAAFDAVALAVGEEPAALATPVVHLGDDPELVAPLQSLFSHLQLAVGAATALHLGQSTQASSSASFAIAPRPSIRDVLSRRSIELGHAIRVGATAAVAALAGILLHRPRGYWIVVTAVLVLQPHSGTTLRRGLQRVAGTVVGAMAAALLAPLVHGQIRAALVLFVLALAAAAVRKHNYAVYAALMTPLFVLMAESYSGDWNLAGTRITATLLGGVVALVGAYAWPQRERERLPAMLAQVLRSTRALLESALAGVPSHLARREAGLALANADAAFERFLDEGHTDAEAEALMAVRSQARRLVGAITALSAGGRMDEELAPAARQIEAALDQLASAAEERRPPLPLPKFPAGPQAERLLRPVEVIHSALTRLAR
jgi:uncharacterized membrane protein YccC